MENFNLDSIKKFFPLTDKAVDGNGLLTCIICYIIVAAIGGASVIRVHDVREAKESILYLEALRSYGTV